jgi:hypothetical protein
VDHGAEVTCLGATDHGAEVTCLGATDHGAEVLGLKTISVTLL